MNSQYQKQKLSPKPALLVMLGCLSLANCAVYEPYQGDRTPVEVRRGDVYDGQTYPQQPPHDSRSGGYGVPAPSQNRPVYSPSDEFPRDQNQSGADQTDVNNANIDGEDNRQQSRHSVPAVGRLLAQADASIQREEYDRAIVSAESALRLDPQSVEAFNTLARAYLFSQRYDESEQMALRAISLLRSRGASSDSEATNQLWRLIAETRRNRGDKEGAEKAMARSGGRF